MKNPVICEREFFHSTPLCWQFKILERILFVETLTEAYAKTTFDPEGTCPVCPENYKNRTETRKRFTEWVLGAVLENRIQTLKKSFASVRKKVMLRVDERMWKYIRARRGGGVGVLGLVMLMMRQEGDIGSLICGK